MTANRSTIKAGSNNRDNTTDSFPLEDLLEDIKESEIYPKFSLNDCGMFAQASQASGEAVAFLQLLPVAVDGEPESYKLESYKPGDETKLAAIAILHRHLKKDPELLFKKGLVTDHYGRKIWASAYRIFCGTLDVWALRKVHEEILPKIKDGEAKAQADFKAQFPNCPWPFNPEMGEEVLYDDRNKEQIKQVAAQLQVIDAKITADPCTKGFATIKETVTVVEELRQIYLPKEDEVIRTGLYFPPAIQRMIHEVYNDRYIDHVNEQPNAWSGDQLDFFSRQVIGTMEDALTSVDGQCAKTGRNNLNMKIGPDRNDGLFCRRPKGIPETLAPLKGKLGRRAFIDPDDGYICYLTAADGKYSWYAKNGPAYKPLGNNSCGDTVWKTYTEQKLRLMWVAMRPFKEKLTHLDDEQSRTCAIL